MSPLSLDGNHPSEVLQLLFIHVLLPVLREVDAHLLIIPGVCLAQSLLSFNNLGHEDKLDSHERVSVRLGR